MIQKNNTVLFERAMNDAINLVEQRFAIKHGAPVGLSTGFEGLDHAISGLKPQQLVVLGAKQVMGQSLFAMNIAQNIAKLEKKAVGYFSLGVRARRVATTMLSSVSRLEWSKLTMGDLEVEDWDKLSNGANYLRSIPLMIDDRPLLDLNAIRESIKNMSVSLNQDLSILFIDGLEYIQPTAEQKGWSKSKFEAYLCMELKKLAQEKNLVVFVVDFLNSPLKQPDSKSPMLSHLSLGISLEKNADTILLLHYEAVVDPGADPLVVINVAKNNDGPLCTVQLILLEDYFCFEHADNVD